MKKNQLESFIFKLKEITEDDVKKPFLKESEIDTFLKKSQEIDDYMFSDEIMNADLYNITSKIFEINSLINPLTRRMEEHKNRDDLFKVSIDRFANFTKEVEKIKSRKNWIPESNVTEIFNFINDEKQKLEELYKKQVDMALHMDPVFTMDAVKQIGSIVDHKIKDLRRIPKPKNNTDTTNSTDTGSAGEFNIDDLKNFDPSNFDPSKMNLDPSSLEQMQKKMEELKK